MFPGRVTVFPNATTLFADVITIAADLAIGHHQRLSSTAGAVGRRLGKCHYKYQVNTTTTNRTSSGNPFLSNFIPTPGNEAEEK
ncbi:unnamed protein product [Boreogadus saida]